MAAEVVAVVDYGAGNLRSVARVLAAAGASDVRIATTPADIAAADRIVLPGVGAFAQCIGALGASGLVAALDTAVHAHAKPFLGICVGMQLLATTGHEHGEHAGLDWLAGDVTRLDPGAAALKIPHMGWNDVRGVDDTVPDGAAYFVHSYRFVPADPATIRAKAEYGQEIAAVVALRNITGVQFHPEKSQAYGLQFLQNWLSK